MITAHTRLERTRVAEAMNPGVIACGSDATLVEVARLLSSYRVHAVAVYRPDEAEHIWAFVSDTDVLAALALARFETLTAGAIAGTEPLTVQADDTLAGAAARMAEHQCSHAVVLRDGVPAGVISSLDVARHVGGLAWGE